MWLGSFYAAEGKIMKNSGMVVDPFGITKIFLKATEYWMQNGMELSGMLLKLTSELQTAGTEEIRPFLDQGSYSKVSNTDLEVMLLALVNNYSRLMQKVHGAYAGWLRTCLEGRETMSEHEKEVSSFWVGQLVNLLAPANYFWTNPSAVQKFLRSKGKSAINGYRNWTQDVERGDNLVNIADTTAFQVGENLATTPGFVVYRNRMMELIQYSPRTETTFDIPVVFIQPWINKYYIFDLTEDKSFVSYLVDQGFTVFIVSWKNPTAEMRDVTFDDYMIRGALKAIEVAQDICGVEQVHAAGYCIGGTVLTALMAWLNRGRQEDGPVPVRDYTLFASLVDYSSPGELGVFINNESVKLIERLADKAGYLDKKYLSATFRLLRSNDLIWRYYNHNYLQGEVPPKSEFLYWNCDSTRLPAAMSSFYLREFYLNNKLVKEDQLRLAGRPVDLRRIEQPLYAVGAEQDHICPWKETFKTCGNVGGKVRFTLATEGHITGIVNPPSKRSKRKYWTGDVNGHSDADQWRLSQPEQIGSWWTDWVTWLSDGCTRRTPPPMGNSEYRALEKAPGSYVKAQ
jgi:polyhydroxyalkanoate synthase